MAANSIPILRLLYACTLLAPAATKAAWLGYRGNIQRNGVGGVAARVSGDLQQLFFAQPLLSGVEGGLSSPVLGAGTLLYVDVCGGVHMYSTAQPNATTPASPLWTYSTGAGCGGGFSAALSGTGAGAVVIAVAGSAGVFSLAADSGALLWQYTEAPDLAFRGEPLIVTGQGLVSVSTNDPASPVYHLNLTTGGLVKTTSFGDESECLASDLALGALEGDVYEFYTACGIEDSPNLMFRIHLDTGAADSVSGFGDTGEHPPVYVEDHSSDPVHAVVYDLSDGVLGGAYVLTFGVVSACACGSQDFAGMALAAPSAGRPDLLPPLFASANPATSTLAFFSPAPAQSGPPPTPLPACALNASTVLRLADGRPASLTDALPTVDSLGRVFLADQGGNLFMVERTGDAATATLLWTSPTRQPVFGEVAIADTGALFFADYSGAIYGVAGSA